MAELSKQDIDILGYYADKGNRELYWNYLTHLPGNDGYGLLALGVVRNDNMPGAVANNFAQDYAKDNNGIVLNEREWENFGQYLIKRDFEARQAYMNHNQPDKALNLPVRDVQKAHEEAFRKKGIDPDAWTPRQLLEAARRHGGESAAADVWHKMLDSSYLGGPRLVGTLGDMNNYFSDNKLHGASYLSAMTRAEGEAALDRNQVDPNTIGVTSFYYNYDSKQREWSSISVGDSNSMPMISRVTDQSKIDELNDARAVRLERQEKATQFHSLDPYHTIATSPHTVADAETPASQTTALRDSRQQRGDSVEDLFMRITNAAMRGNWDGVRAAAQDYQRSEAGQAWLQSGRDYNQAQAQQAQQREQSQSTQDEPARRGISIG